MSARSWSSTTDRARPVWTTDPMERLLPPLPSAPARRLAALVLGALLALPLTVRPVRAQEAPEFETLRPSTAPAFILLDLSPSAVERPTTPADLALSFVNRTNHLTQLPENFAVEVSPHWLRSHPRLSWRSDVTRSFEESIRRTLTISAASASIGTDERPISGISIGARTLLMSGRISRASQDSLAKVERALSLYSQLVQTRSDALTAQLDAAFLAQLRATDTIPEPRRLAVQQALTQAREQAKREVLDRALAAPEVAEERERLRKVTNGLAIAREGLTVELAVGGSWAAADQSWERAGFHRGGAWLAASWEQASIGSETAVTPIVVGRLLAGGDTVPNVADAGLRLLLHNPRYSFSVEGVYRWALEDTEEERKLYRVAGIVEYQLFPNSWIIGTFGRDQTTPARGNLLAQLGFKTQFSRQRYKAE